MRHASGWYTTPHAGSQPPIKWPCARTIPCRSSVPYVMTTDTSARPMPISYEIICADPRMPPSNDRRLFDAQPASTTPYTPSDIMAST